MSPIISFYSYTPKVRELNSSLPAYFAHAIQVSRHREFLHPFTEEDFEGFRLFKIRGIDAGFAIKPDGDIVSVHNNDRIARGLRRDLIKHAIASGGTKLDHFDGYLNRVFAWDFPIVENVVQWNDEYAPKGWKYLPVDPVKCFTKNFPKDYYLGKPAVIYRRVPGPLKISRDIASTIA
jgi:hypothetical protein